MKEIIKDNLDDIKKINAFLNTVDKLQKEYKDLTPLDMHPRGKCFSSADMNNKGFDYASISPRYGYFDESDPAELRMYKEIEYAEGSFIRLFGSVPVMKLGNYKNYRINPFEGWKSVMIKQGYSENSIRLVEETMAEEINDLS